MLPLLRQWATGVASGVSWSSYWATRNPSGLTVESLTDTSVKVDWTANGVEDYDGYSIERSLDGITYADVDTVAVGTETFTDTVTADTLYYYRVRAYKGINYSDYTDVAVLEYGPELNKLYDFSTDVGFTKSAGVVIADGKCTMTVTSGGGQWFYPAGVNVLNLTAGVTYRIALETTLVSGTGQVMLSYGAGTEVPGSPIWSTDTVFEFTPASNLNGWGIKRYTLSGNYVFELDNFSIKKKNLAYSKVGDVLTITNTRAAPRILVVSDNHYGINYTPPSDQNMTYQQRNDLFIESIIAENEVRPIDFVIVAGDFADVNAGYGNLWNFLSLKNAIKRPCFFVEGNHDAITAAEWGKHFDYPQNYVIEYGDYVFIVVNNYEDTTNASPAVYNNIDDEWITEVLARYDTEKLILISHMSLSDTNLLAKFTAKENAIVGVFGHWHLSGLQITQNGVPFYCSGHFSVAADYDWSTGNGYGFFSLDVIDGKMRASGIKVPHEYNLFTVEERTETVYGFLE